MEMANVKMVDVLIRPVLILVNVMKDLEKIPGIYVEVSLSFYYSFVYLFVCCLFFCFWPICLLLFL